MGLIQLRVNVSPGLVSLKWTTFMMTRPFPIEGASTVGGRVLSQPPQDSLTALLCTAWLISSRKYEATDSKDYLLYQLLSRLSSNWDPSMEVQLSKPVSGNRVSHPCWIHRGWLLSLGSAEGKILPSQNSSAKPALLWSAWWLLHLPHLLSFVTLRCGSINVPLCSIYEGTSLEKECRTFEQKTGIEMISLLAFYIHLLPIMILSLAL